MVGHRTSRHRDDSAGGVLVCRHIPLTLALQAYRVVTWRFHPLSHLPFASLWCTLAAEWLLLGAREPRYMLPIVVPL